jgi:electron transfer flavoprotein beta subunit
MNIVVILKQVPDTESAIRIAGDGKSIVSEGIKWIVNPYDEFAVEAALRLKEKHKGKVTILSYGPQRVTESIRTALAMGADDAVLIGEDAIESSGRLRLAKALAAAVQSLSPDIVLMGSRAVDYDMAQRGPMIAELLGWPHLPLAVSIESDGDKIAIKRPIEGGSVTMESTLPVLVTLGGSHAVWNPRFASLPGIMKAKKKPLAVKKLADIGLDPAQFAPGAGKTRTLSLEMPQERQAGRIVDGGLDTDGKARELVRLLHQEAKVI